MAQADGIRRNLATLDPAERTLLCVLACVLGEENLSPELERRLKAAGVDLDGIRTCLRSICKGADG